MSSSEFPKYFGTPLPHDDDATDTAPHASRRKFGPTGLATVIVFCGLGAATAFDVYRQFRPEATRSGSGPSESVAVSPFVADAGPVPYGMRFEGAAAAIARHSAPQGTQVETPAPRPGRTPLGMQRLGPHAGPVRGVVFAATGRHVATIGLARLHLWDTQTGGEAFRFAGHTDEAWGLDWSRNGRLIATGSADRHVRLWDGERGRPKAVLVGHQATVSVVAFSPDGNALVSAAEDGSVRAWHPETHLAQARFAGHDGAVTALAFVGDGATFVTAGVDRTLRVWQVDDGRELRRWDVASIVTKIAAVPGVPSFATSDLEGRVVVRDAVTGSERLAFRPNAEGVEALAMSPDGTTLATADLDGAVRSWELATGRLVEDGRFPMRRVECLAFAPDGGRLAAGCADGYVYVWPTKSLAPSP